MAKRSTIANANTPRKGVKSTAVAPHLRQNRVNKVGFVGEVGLIQDSDCPFPDDERLFFVWQRVVDLKYLSAVEGFAVTNLVDCVLEYISIRDATGGVELYDVAEGAPTGALRARTMVRKNLLDALKSLSLTTTGRWASGLLIEGQADSIGSDDFDDDEEFDSLMPKAALADNVTVEAVPDVV